MPKCTRQGFIIIAVVLVVGFAALLASVYNRANAASYSSSYSSRSYSTPTRSYSTSSSVKPTTSVKRSYTAPKTSTYTKPKTQYTPVTTTSLPAATAAKKKKKAKIEYDYYPMNDCTIVSTVNFTGYRCIDRD